MKVGLRKYYQNASLCDSRIIAAVLVSTTIPSNVHFRLRELVLKNLRTILMEWGTIYRGLLSRLSLVRLAAVDQE